MDLWILSQDKRSMCKATFLKICKNCFSEWCVFDNDNELGGYATEERALEVLGEIQKLLMNDVFLFKNFDISPKDLESFAIDNARVYSSKDGNTQIEHIQRNCVVFEMPEE